MQRQHGRFFTMSVSVGALVVLAVAPGCKKKKPPAKADPEVVEVQRVETPLQVTTVSPSEVAADTAGTKVAVYGSGFEDGVEVTFGSAAGTSVEVIDPNSLELIAPALPAGTYDVTVKVGSKSTALRKGFVVKGPTVASVDCSFSRISFGFNSASLDAQGRGALDEMLGCYQQRTGLVTITGHADERGTTDYNLALGQRRAQTVQRYLATNGVASSRIKTVSYGEERPLKTGSTEAAWAANRRAEIESK